MFFGNQLFYSTDYRYLRRQETYQIYQKLVQLQRLNLIELNCSIRFKFSLRKTNF